MLEHGSRGSSRREDREPRPAQAIAPIYKRLPKGPHGITPKGVAHHQRIRMHGAMIEAVAMRGYRNTSVKHVIGLAGVSRRAFYEQFSNKEDCFLETFDLIVRRGIKRINHAYRSTAGTSEERMRSAFVAFVEEVQSNSKALHLVVIDAQTAGFGGLRRLRRITAMFEGLLSNSFADRRETEALPLPVVRAIVGGVRRATFTRLREERVEDLAELAEELLRWSLVFRSPAVAELSPRPCANPQFTHPARLEPTEGPQSERTRILRAAIDLVLRDRFDDLSALRVADEANVSIESFLALFPDKEECYLAALDMMADEVLQLVADPELVSAEWSRAVCKTIESLLEYLASHPACAISLLGRAPEAGPRAVEHTMDLALELATLLTEGAPQPPPGELAVEGIAGALWHTLSSEIVADRGHRLPLLAEYLSYTVLTPFVGAEEAVRAILASRPSVSAAARGATFGEVHQQRAGERGDDDHDDERRASGAEDPVDLDRFEVEDGEQRREHGEQHKGDRARELATAALGLPSRSVAKGGGHVRLDASRTQSVARQARAART
jgi:AcrR family transcriptional regulator